MIIRENSSLIFLPLSLGHVVVVVVVVAAAAANSFFSLLHSFPSLISAPIQLGTRRRAS